MRDITPGRIEWTDLGNSGKLVVVLEKPLPQNSEFPPLSVESSQMMGQSSDQQRKQSWADVVNNGYCMHGGMALNCLPPGMNIVVQMDREDVNLGMEKWKNAVVCFTIGAYPPYNVIKKRWKPNG